MLGWYVDHFSVRQRPVRQSKIAIIQQAQSLPVGYTIPLSAVGLKEHGNLLELDGYPVGPGYVAAARPCPGGGLPPGNAMVSFKVADLDAVAHLAPSPPAARAEPGYDGARACVLRGPAGELIELIEAP
jgi:catechol 2,3-dioxygenase-like lactoylglutathione lyase family enzyme